MMRTRVRANFAVAPCELVSRARRGSRLAFDALWQHYGRGVRAVLLSMLPEHECEDLAQEVAIAAYRALPSLVDARCFPAWLHAIARNHARDALAARARSPEAPLDSAPPAALVARSDGRLLADEVRGEIRELPRCHRGPLILRLLLGLSGAEIAARLGMTHGSVRVNLCRGMKLLRERLDGPR